MSRIFYLRLAHPTSGDAFHTLLEMQYWQTTIASARPEPLAQEPVRNMKIAMWMHVHRVPQWVAAKLEGTLLNPNRALSESDHQEIIPQHSPRNHGRVGRTRRGRVPQGVHVPEWHGTLQGTPPVAPGENGVRRGRGTLGASIIAPCLSGFPVRTEVRIGRARRT